MVYRGPDGTALWHGGSVGFGHALLRTYTPGEESAPQVRVASDGLSIVADARIDGREDLVRELRSSNGHLSAASPVTELLLAAYRMWGEQCPEHLLGDYAFTIWDEGRKSLFAARDPFGVKPLFWAEVGGTVIVGNTIATLRAYPDISSRLDERSIGDYLLFGGIFDEALTYFAEIHNVPRGTAITFTPEGKRERKFWSVPQPLELRYRRQSEYLEHFETVFLKAVADRLSGGPVVVELSGGLDSGTVAAAASEVLGERGRPHHLHAVSVGYERLFADPEVNMSAITARALGIPRTFVAADDLLLDPSEFPAGGRGGLIPSANQRVGIEAARKAADHARVALTGHDGDLLLSAHRLQYAGSLLRQGRLLRLTSDLMALARMGVANRRPPRIGLWTALGRVRSPSVSDPFANYARWIRPEFDQRAQLRQRWEQVASLSRHSRPDPRQIARRLLAAPLWSALFEGYDMAYTGLPVEYRHPLLDLRVVEFMLALPPVPWCVEKGMLRAFLKDRLPPVIWRRRKEALQGDPVALKLQAGSGVLRESLDIREDAPVREFVSIHGSFSELVSGGKVDLHFVLRAVILNHWVKQSTLSPFPHH
jgi:asparagine synthase (glutamine-hydrolysing)